MQDFDSKSNYQMRFQRLATIQGTRYAVLPVHTVAEQALFKSLLPAFMELSDFSGVDWQMFAAEWSSKCDGQSIFYKLAEHLDNHYTNWEKARHEQNSLLLHSETHHPLVQQLQQQRITAPAPLTPKHLIIEAPMIPLLSNIENENADIAEPEIETGTEIQQDHSSSNQQTDPNHSIPSSFQLSQSSRLPKSGSKPATSNSASGSASTSFEKLTATFKFNPISHDLVQVNRKGRSCTNPGCTNPRNCNGRKAANAITFAIRENILMKSIIGPESGNYHKTLKFHIGLGYASALCFTLHTLHYLLFWTFEGTIMENLYPWVSANSYLNFAGLVAWLALMVMMLFSVYKIRRMNFRVFYWSHQMYVVFFAASLPLLYFIWDRISPRLTLTRRKTQTRISRLSHNLLKLDFPLPHSQPPQIYVPGDYINILIPSISQFSWHPFTISSYYADSSHFASITIAVQKRNRWTEQVYNLLSHQDSVVVPARIEGIFGSKSTAYLSYDRILFIGGGTGVAALEPFIQHYLRVKLHGKVTVLWVAKTTEQVKSFPGLVRLVKSNRDVELKLYLTRQEAMERLDDSEDDSGSGNNSAVSINSEKLSVVSQDPSTFSKTPKILPRRTISVKKMFSLLLAVGVFGLGIVGYCLARVFLVDYDMQKCMAGDSNLYSGWLHFVCWYYYPIAPPFFACLFAVVAGLIISFLFNLRQREEESVEFPVESDVDIDVNGLDYKSGRPNFKELFGNSSGFKGSDDGVIAVMAAGPEGIVREVENQTVGNPRYVFIRESWKV
ncbi:hypothetical protein HK098_000939 [Nowakowskiella sp. JEL0407]|nr:hypothetical protein HK098_000939 [Nowakowskiella sp. JEL0407]